MNNILPHFTTRSGLSSTNISLSATSRLPQTTSIAGSPTAAIALRTSTFDIRRPSSIALTDQDSSDGFLADKLSDAQRAEVQKSVDELVFAGVFSDVHEAMDKRPAVDEENLEQTVHKTFDDFIETRIGELIITDFLPAFLNNELLHKSLLEPAVKTTVNHQLHVALASPMVADTQSTVIADLDRTDGSVDLLTSIMTRNPASQATAWLC